VPWPVDYGGVFDLYYKIRALSEAGISIHLHCFSYGRGPAPELDNWCVEVHYYERKTPLTAISGNLPHIVASRANKKLLQNLLADDYPILMEGIHCTYFLHSGQLPAERCFVRLHNVEHQYYHQLSETCSAYLKKLYYNRESRLLYDYERSLARRGTFWTVSKSDLDYFHEELGYPSIDFLPLFLPTYETSYNEKQGNFCLYHGNLGVPENEYAATWLLENIFFELEIPFVIAGKNPSQKLESLAHKEQHTCLVANPNEREMQELIRMAQVNVLPSFNTTGIKLKLINALYLGKHCVVNSAGVEGSGLEACCEVVSTTPAFRDEIAAQFSQPYTEEKYEQRQHVLANLFNNRKNAGQMIKWIFGGMPTTPHGNGF
jgi:hypothetical protein